MQQAARGVTPAAALGFQRQNETYGGMQALAQALAAQSRGEGPNPALAQLAQTTGQNAAQTAALMASSRGSAANPGMIARQAAQQGSALQQQAVGQAATLRAQQQLAAQQALQQQQAQQAQLATTQVGEGLNAANQDANAALAMNQLIGNQVNALNQANLANAAQQNQANSAVQAKAAGSNFLGDTLGGIGKAIGSAVGIKLAEGGEVPSPRGPQSEVGRFLSTIGDGTKKLAKGGPVNASLKASGGKVPGTAKVKGDSYSNDTVPAKLSPGEIVLPRSVTQSKDPVSASAKFVAAVMARKRRR